jgi:hypothetical protein
MADSLSMNVVRSSFEADPSSTSVQNSNLMGPSVSQTSDGCHQDNFHSAGEIDENLAEAFKKPAKSVHGDLKKCDSPTVEKNLGNKQDKDQSLIASVGTKSCCRQLAPEHSVSSIPDKCKNISDGSLMHRPGACT